MDTPTRTEAWNEGMRQLHRFRATHGHVLVPRAHVTVDGYPLGQFVQDLRKRRRRGRLALWQVAECDTHGFVWDVYEHDFQIGVAHLREFVAAHGHGAPPQAHVTDCGFPLGRFVKNRRLERRTGSLAPVRVALLDDAGIVWHPRHAARSNDVPTAAV